MVEHLEPEVHRLSLTTNFRPRSPAEICLPGFAIYTRHCELCESQRTKRGNPECLGATLDCHVVRYSLTTRNDGYTLLNHAQHRALNKDQTRRHCEQSEAIQSDFE